MCRWNDLGWDSCRMEVLGCLSMGCFGMFVDGMFWDVC